MTKGKFITIYGINNIGKTTHAKRLVDRLRKDGFKAEYLKYPVYELEPTGPFLNRMLRSGKQNIPEDQLQLWFVLNRCQFQPKLQKMLNKGIIVVAEDYTGTGIGWGIAKGLTLSWMEEINKYLLKEDLAIFLHGKRDTRAVEENHVHEQNPDLLKKSESVFRKLAEKYKWQKVKLADKIEDTAEKCWQAAIKTIKKAH
ncbi:hypothetical protein HYW82_02940 [Candidatus Peregrinibacteria bacterium]|nr:hypothetical protein [Candidatus Peregrinibacteria bacterium]